MQSANNNINEFSQKYEEIELIGRGSFGTATLVRNKADKSLAIAKKVMLEGLKPKEQESAQLEAKLLKDLNHP